MPFKVLRTPEASRQYQALKDDPALEKRFKAVRKAQALLQQNPRHPGLNTHEYSSLKGPNGEKVFEAYAENKTPGAYRIFWYYGKNKGEIIVFAITPHP
jgi:hypothetical protein